ncbi:MAG: hypothetical protein WBP13_00275 [Methylophilaceae bacterium]
MKFLRATAVILAIVAASATSALARDYYSVGINVGNDGYGRGYDRPVGYSSNYSLGYSNRPNVVYEPRAVYYAPIRYYEPVVVQSYGGYRHNGYRDHDHGDRGYERHDRNEHRGWGHGHHDHDD